MVFHDESLRVSIPVSRVYYAQVSTLDPERHLLMKDISWYSAERGLYYPPKAKLLRQDLRVTEQRKKLLESIVGPNTAVLVGDISESDHATALPGSAANEIIQHMEQREELFRKRKIPLKNDGTYQSLLKTPGIFQTIQAIRTQGFPRNYTRQRDIMIAIAIDGTIPEIFAGKEAGRKCMANAIRIGDELQFQQRYFFRNDTLTIHPFGETTTEATRDYQKATVWRVGGKRNTTSCLNKIIDKAQKHKGYTHIYLVTTGIADDVGIIDVASRIHPQKQKGSTTINAGLTQIIVGEHWKKKAEMLAQFPFVA